jgi:hypothetical protein
MPASLRCTERPRRVPCGPDCCHQRGHHTHDTHDLSAEHKIQDGDHEQRDGGYYEPSEHGIWSRP